MAINSSSNDRLIRKIYGEIIVGYSFAKFFGEIAYIKHLGVVDFLEFDYKYQELYKEYLNAGILSEEEKLKVLISDGLWEEKKEKRIAEIKQTISAIQITKRSHFSLKEIESCNAQIKQNHGWLIDLLGQKASLIGESAESMARRNIDSEQIVKSFYLDDKLEKRKFNSHDDLSEKDISEAFRVYEMFNTDVSDMNIKRVSLSYDFQSAYSLTDNLYYFFGSPITKLTNNQNRVASYGNYYKHILSGDRQVPEELREDPEKLEDWYFARSNVEKIIQKDEANGKATSLFGVTSKELKYLGVEVDDSHNKGLRRLLAEKGGEVSLDDIKKAGL